MRKSELRVGIVVLYILVAVALRAQNPNGYYNGAGGKKGAQLKTALHLLTRRHTILDYGALWSAFVQTDKRTDGTVWDMYSDNVRRFEKGSGMNREHSLPKSWWGGDENDAYSDLNHLFPADADANAAKSNWPLGEVGEAKFDNGTSKVGSNVFGGYSGTVFEPDDRYKGDFARAYFYMVTCYQDLNEKWKFRYMVEANAYPTLKPWAVGLLLKWHRNDPVSDKEVARNEAVFRLQNNRNPFVDYPVLAELIWGSKKGEPFVPDAYRGATALVTPVEGAQLVFGSVLAGECKTKSVFVKGAGLKGNSLAVVLEGAHRAMFKVDVTAIAVGAANATGGYELKVTYCPKEAGKVHRAVLVISGGGMTERRCVAISGKCIERGKAVAGSR